MLYNKKCSNPKCGCRKFYMRWTGYHIELRCMEGHYNTNVAIKKDYPILRQYEDIDDRTGLNKEMYKDTNILDMQAHNLEDTVNGDLMKRRSQREYEKSDMHKSNRRTQNYQQQYAKTGTDNTHLNLLSNLEIY